MATTKPKTPVAETPVEATVTITVSDMQAMVAKAVAEALAAATPAPVKFVPVAAPVAVAAEELEVTKGEKNERGSFVAKRIRMVGGIVREDYN